MNADSRRWKSRILNSSLPASICVHPRFGFFSVSAEAGGGRFEAGADELAVSLEGGVVLDGGGARGGDGGVEGDPAFAAGVGGGVLDRDRFGEAVGAKD